MGLMEDPPMGVILSGTAPQGWLTAAVGLERARRQLLDACEGAAPESLAADALVRALWRLAAPRPVDACFPLFVLYTSGSTSKPKGIVHTHGGYQVGLCLTSRVVFNVNSAQNTFLVIANPGWITGQSCERTQLATQLATRAPRHPLMHTQLCGRMTHTASDDAYSVR